MKKPILLNPGHSDYFGTPPDAVDILLPYLDTNLPVWECASNGQSNITRRLREEGYTVMESTEADNFLVTLPDDYCTIVTNPPFSMKERFLQRCYQLEMPFALLMPLTALEGKVRQSMYRRYGIKLLIPNKRFNFLTPSGKGSGSWFATAWYTWGLPLPDSLTFVEVSI